MKAAPKTLQSVANIECMKTTGQVRRVGSEMLLALVRKEISATDVEAGAKMIAAISMNMQTEVKLAMAAMTIRDSGANLAKIEHFGATLIGDTSEAS